MSLEAFVVSEVRLVIKNYIGNLLSQNNKSIDFKVEANSDSLRIYEKELNLHFKFHYPRMFISVNIPYETNEAKKYIGTFLQNFVADHNTNIFNLPDSPLKKFSEYLEIYKTVIPKIELKEDEGLIKIRAICTEHSLHNAKIKIKNIEEHKKSARKAEEINALHSQIQSYKIGTAFFNRILRPLLLLFSNEQSHQQYIRKILGALPKFYY